MSLRYPILEQARWQSVLDVVQQRLLTPVGLRSLAPGHPDYKATYDGDLRARDAAYHQGTVWGWLIGPFVDAWLKVYPETGPARDVCSKASCHTSANPVWVPSVRFSMRSPHLHPADVSRSGYISTSQADVPAKEWPWVLLLTKCIYEVRL
jgi:glycogen debranching enzyme